LKKLQPAEHAQVVDLVIVIQWKVTVTITNFENEMKRQATAGSNSMTLRDRWLQT
jgi:hypothetical protein